MRKASTCPRATQDVESARGTHWVGRTAPLAVPCRDNSAIPRQTGSLLSQLRSSAFVGPRLSALGILGEAARSGSARHAAGRCTAISRPPEPPGACIRAWPHDHDSRKRPSRLAITDNGSGRVGCGPPAWARLYCIHIQSCGSWPVRTGRAIRPGVVFGSQGSPAQSLGGDARCRCCDQPSSCAHAVISFRGISVLGGEYVVGPLLVADRQVPPWRAWVGRLFGSSLAVGYPPF